MKSYQNHLHLSTSFSGLRMDSHLYKNKVGLGLPNKRFFGRGYPLPMLVLSFLALKNRIGMEWNEIRKSRKYPFIKAITSIDRKSKHILITLYECLYSLMEYGRQKKRQTAFQSPIQECTKPIKRSIHAGFRREQAHTLCKPFYNFL